MGAASIDALRPQREAPSTLIERAWPLEVRVMGGRPSFLTKESRRGPMETDKNAEIPGLPDPLVGIRNE